LISFPFTITNMLDKYTVTAAIKKKTKYIIRVKSQLMETLITVMVTSNETH